MCITRVSPNRAGRASASLCIVLLLSIGLLLSFIPVYAAEQFQKLTGSNASPSDVFGDVLATDGTTAVISARGHNDGAAYVFIYDGSQWTEQALLEAVTDPDFYQLFGASVAIDGDTILVGAPGADFDRGAAYVFVRSGTTWTEQARLTVPGLEENDAFGDSVAIAGDTVVIGAPEYNIDGAAFVFTRSGSQWTQAATLLSEDDDFFSDLYFGESVAIDNGTILVGASGFNENEGAAFVFTGAGSTWTRQARLRAKNPSDNDELGVAVALDGDTALVGALGRFTPQEGKGRVYAFTRSGGTWTQQARFSPTDGQAGDFFGLTLALKGDTALINAPAHGSTGAVYAYTRSGSTWKQSDKLSEGRSVIGVGLAIADNGHWLVGAPMDNQFTGAVYVYDPTAMPTLMDNGGFENALKGWAVKAKSGDKVKCNTDKPTGYTGDCAFMFKGKPGENSRLIHAVNLKGVALSVGDTFSTSLWSKAKKKQITAAGKLLVIYADGSKDKQAFTAGGSTDWTQQSASVSLSQSAVKKVKLQIRYRRAGGKLFVDDVTLTHTAAGGGLSTGLLPIPPTP